MKRFNWLYVLSLAVILLGFSGCEKAEQTELNIDDCQYTATIKGTLLYPAGMTATDFVGGTPAAGETVFVDVPYSYYSEGVSGTKRFTATTNSNGEFTFTIPAKIASTYASISVESFQGKHFVLEPCVQDGENNYVPKYVEKDVIYNMGAIPVTISASKIEYKNLGLAYNVVGAEPEFKYTATYLFKVERFSFEVTDDVVVPAIKWLPVKNKDVIVKVTRYNSNKEHFYIGKSNADGDVSIQIPVSELEEEVKITVSANPYRGSLTIYEYDSEKDVYIPENKTGVFSTSGFVHYYSILKVLQPVQSPHKVQFEFTAD